MTSSASQACSAAAAPLTPCVRQCKLDAAGHHCLSCKRTRHEIALWGRMSQDERRTIMENLKLR